MLIFFLLLQVAAAGSEENENFENPVYSSVTSTSLKETPQSTDAPPVGKKNAVGLPCLFSAPDQKNGIVREAVVNLM